MTVSIVTPWRNHAELIPDYEAAVLGAEVIIVDNASDSEPAAQLVALAARNGWRYLRNDENQWFSAANNQGLAAATGEIIMFLNNDICADAAGWLADVENDMRPNALMGPALDTRLVSGRVLVYVEGWCIAGYRETWDRLGGWTDFVRPYWEDNALCWRAQNLGIKLIRRAWPLRHINNATSRTEPGAFDASETNKAAFERMVADA